MASLPNKAFMFNYNAKEYNGETHTFPKTTGQLFDEDLVLTNSPASYTDEYVDFSLNSGIIQSWAGKSYEQISDNPFNRNSQNNTFTFIYKTSGFTSNMENIFANRNYDYNYMVRGSIFHTSSPTFLTLEPNTNPQICVVRIQSNGYSERMFVDDQGNVLQSVNSNSISWGGMNDGISFFSGQYSGSEYFTGIFYWMYCSMEALTDAEILQVIQYNEGGRFGLDSTGSTIQAGGGTSTATLYSETGWTATTASPWASVSPASGDSGETLITFTAGKNTFEPRTGVVTFTSDGGDTTEYTINQEGNDGKLPINKMYRNGRRIN